MGRLLAPPFGREGLKVAEAREVVAWMSSPPVGSTTGVLVLGPMDLATPEAQDCLLKSLEEVDSRILQPILWAWDSGAVVPTILSRCLTEWCPHGTQLDMEFEPEAQILVQAALARDRVSTVSGLKEFESDNKERDHRYRDLLGSAALVVSEKLKVSEKPSEVQGLLDLWDSLRLALRSSRPSALETLAALLLPSPRGGRS
jgi:hypothetical protein